MFGRAALPQCTKAAVPALQISVALLIGSRQKAVSGGVGWVSHLHATSRAPIGNSATMQRWAAGFARAAALLKQMPALQTTSRSRCSVCAAQQIVTPRRSSAARVTRQCQRRSWRCGSQLVHASTLVSEPPQPADGELTHDVDVLIEGAPLPLDRCAAEWSAIRDTLCCTVCLQGCCSQRMLLYQRLLMTSNRSKAASVPFSR